jgi:type IX secretion system PorP/SprF family membrane protein
MKIDYTLPLLLLTLVSSTLAKAQQQPNFLFFEQNMGIYNPAFTGSEGAFVGLGYRAAWSGIEDAPRATSLLYNSKEKNKASWGFSYLSDKVYVEQQGMASVDYSYKLQFNENTNLHLGVKAGANFNNIDLDRLNRITQENNESLGNIQNYLNPLIGVGAYLKSDAYFFGLSVPNFLNTKRFKEVNGIEATATDKPHLYASGGLNWKVNNTISVEPSFLYRMVSDAPNQITAIGKINFKDQLQLGMGVSNNDYLSAMIIFNGMKRLDFGYGYEMGQRTSTTALRANTHELFLRFKFGNQATQAKKEDNKSDPKTE